MCSFVAVPILPVLENDARTHQKVSGNQVDTYWCAKYAHAKLHQHHQWVKEAAQTSVTYTNTDDILLWPPQFFAQSIRV